MDGVDGRDRVNVVDGVDGVASSSGPREEKGLTPPSGMAILRAITPGGALWQTLNR